MCTHLNKLHLHRISLVKSQSNPWANSEAKQLRQQVLSAYIVCAFGAHTTYDAVTLQRCAREGDIADKLYVNYNRQETNGW